MEKERLSFEELEQELEEFKKEKEKVRRIIGRIGGKNQAKYEAYINISFLSLVFIVFLLGGVLHKIPFNLSIEIGVFLISMKVAWMIHEQQKINHFQFWMLTSLEFRISDINKKINKLK